MPHSSPYLATSANVHPAKVHRHAVLANAQAGDGSQTLLPPSAHFHYWGLGFKQCSLHHVDRVERHLPYRVFEQ